MISSTLLVDHPSLKEKFLLDKTKTSTLAKLAHTKKKEEKKHRSYHSKNIIHNKRFP